MEQAGKGGNSEIGNLDFLTGKQENLKQENVKVGLG